MRMGYKILSLSAKDVPELFSLSSKILKEDFPAYSPKTANIYATKYFSEKRLRDMLKHRINHVYGVRDDKKKLVACMTLKGEFGGVVFIDLLAVKKEYRGFGIATKLLATAGQWALAHKHHYLWLFTESDKNIDFYKHNGFSYVGLHKGSWFGADEHILSKRLRNEPFPEVFTNYSKYFK